MQWKTLKSEKILQNNFFTIKKDRCEKTDGKIVEEYYTIERSDVAVIAALTPENELILIKQYRYPVDAVDFELPAGYLELNGENIMDAAKRELLEETGYSSNNFEKIGECFASAGTMNNTVHFFLAKNCEKVAEQNLDDNEELTVEIVTWEKSLEMLKNGMIKDLGSVNGLLLAKENISNS
jgi:ADP-ribose pyrophosphatase